MAGRLPFDANQGRQNNGINPQMRAALGLPTIEELFLGQQRAQQEAQRDLHYRRALYQDQLDQQLQELQLRADLAQFNDFSDLRRSLLLSEHQRRTEQEQALIRQALAARQGTSAGVPGAAPAAAPPAATGSVNLQHALSEAQAAQLRYQEQIQRQQEQDQAKRRQEELLLMQVRQAMQEQQSGASAAAPTGQRGLPVPSLQQQPPESPQNVLQSILRRTESAESENAGVSPRRRSASTESDQRPKKKSRLMNDHLSPPQVAPLPPPPPSLQQQQQQQQSLLPPGVADAHNRMSPPMLAPLLKSPPGRSLTGLATLEDVAEAAAQEAIPRLGTVDDLLQAASTESKGFEGAEVLATLRHVDWPESDDEESKAPEEERGLAVSREPAESIVTPFFESYFPALPCEPLYEEKEVTDDEKIQEAEGKADQKAKAKADNANADKKITSELISNILQYPYPVDTWYPSMNSRKRERRQAGETSNEDEFQQDEDLFKETNLRANPKKIRERLAKDVEPGVIEKLPHCRLHRLRTKYTTVSELLFCFQVTDCYPNDMMVNCSRCGTWRHTACGGHYKPVSVRERTAEAFVAVCENCHAEEKYLKEDARGKHFLERQRMEHIRRGLASSAVMRQMSFMKHGGTYKWPMGSVSATHVGGHIRSVQGRHDKSEKQWGELASRLSRRFGYRSKERARTRTKELERLLVCVEDAEGLTDRHNMLLFLDRDTMRPNPIGFEKKRRNIFDPEDMQPPEFVDADSDSSSTASASGCARRGCTMKHRFDSAFCSDACGVAALEANLLKAFHDASDIHPSVLRFSY